MQTCEIRILPEAEDFLSILPQTLVKEGYLSTYGAAEKIVDDIVDFISQLRLPIRWLIILLIWVRI